MSTRDPNDLRDPRFDAAWRAASNEEPPPALDNAIRAAARRVVRAGPHSPAAQKVRVPGAFPPAHWWAPLAVAATLGAIAVGLLQLVNPDKVSAPARDPTVVSDMPAAPAKARAGEDSSREGRAQSAAPAAVAPSSTITPAPPPPMPQSPVVADDARNRSAPPAPASAPAAAPALRKDAAAPFPVEDRAAMNAPAPAPATAAGGGRQDAAIDAAKPSAPVAEPFPADAIKRETKESAAGVAAPSPSMPAETGAAGFAKGKLAAAPEPAARDEATRDAQRSVMQAPLAAEKQLPARRAADTEAARVQAQAETAADAKTDARAKVQPKLAVAEWIVLIRKLRDEGKTDEAAKELTAFRTAYPDHERLLPPDLRDWKPAAR